MNTNDDISIVLKNFRPRPHFAVVANQQHRHSSLSRKQQRSLGFFTNVTYHRKANQLRLFYVHPGVILCTIQLNVSTIEPYSVSFKVRKFWQDENVKRILLTLHAFLTEVCSQFSQSGGDNNPKNDNKASSLFSVVSRLLLSLNTRDMRKSITMNIEGPFLFVEKTQARRDILDLQKFLLRCAATSRKSANLCTPLPFVDDENMASHELAAHRILMSTDSSKLATPPIRRQHYRSQASLLTFLLSSPWTQEGKMSTSSTTVSSRKNPTTSSNSKIVHLCLDLQEALGDDPPRYCQLAQERGVVTVYHGTQIEHVWSILNHGLVNLSDTKMAKNGAMLGNGVYLSTSFDVAYFFATSNNKAVHPKVWNHSSLRNLLLHYSTINSKTLALLLDQERNRIAVSCYCVVEASILLPPSNQTSTATRREGKYFVVPNPQDDLRIKKLYLTLEIISKPKSSLMSLFLVILIASMMFMLFFRN